MTSRMTNQFGQFAEVAWNGREYWLYIHGPLKNGRYQLLGRMFLKADSYDSAWKAAKVILTSGEAWRIE
jgi:hypothetical protein